MSKEGSSLSIGKSISASQLLPRESSQVDLHKDKLKHIIKITKAGSA